MFVFSNLLTSFLVLLDVLSESDSVSDDDCVWMAAFPLGSIEVLLLLFELLFGLLFFDILLVLVSSFNDDCVQTMAFAFRG